MAALSAIRLVVAVAAGMTDSVSCLRIFSTAGQSSGEAAIISELLAGSASARMADWVVRRPRPAETSRAKTLINDWAIWRASPAGSWTTRISRLSCPDSLSSSSTRETAILMSPVEPATIRLLVRGSAETCTAETVRPRESRRDMAPAITSASCVASADLRPTICAPPAELLAVSSSRMSISMVAILSAGAVTIRRLVAASGTMRTGMALAPDGGGGGLRELRLLRREDRARGSSSSLTAS